MNGTSKRWVVFGPGAIYKIAEDGEMMLRKNDSSPWKAKAASFGRNDYTGAGYIRTWIKKEDGTQEKISIHRLVATYFIPKPPGKDCVNHIDGNRLNNHVSNLEWCTHQENISNAKARGAFARKQSIESKMDEFSILALVTFLNAGFGSNSIAKNFNVSKNIISRLRRNSRGISCPVITSLVGALPQKKGRYQNEINVFEIAS